MGKPLLILTMCAVLFLVQGCTLHFKASEVELKTEEPHSMINRSFQLESAGLLGG